MRSSSGEAATDSQQRASASGPSALAPTWALSVGFALLLSFVTMQSLIGIRLPSGTGGFDALVVERLIEVAVYLTVALAAAQLRDLAGKAGAMWACAALCAVDVCVEWVALATGSADLAQTAHLSRCLLGGTAPCALWMAWIELYARLDMRHVMLHYLLANVLQACIAVVLGLDAAAPLSLIITAALPLGSVALLALSRRAVLAGEASEDAGQAEPAHGSTEVRRRVPVAPLVLMATFTLANVFARDVLPSEDRMYATVGVVACLVMLLVVLRRGTMRFGVWPLCGAAFPLTLAGLFGMLLDGSVWGIAATLCTHAGDTLFAVFIGVVLCNVCFRYGASALFLFGVTKAVGSLASLAGALLAFRYDWSDPNALILAAAAMAIALALCYVILTWNRDEEITWGAAAEAVSAGAAAAHPAGPGTGAEDAFAGTRPELLARCSRAAYEFGLTRREEEVLALLAQDMTAQQIEEELCVSNSTVKSHTHAVYQKMGLHSRTELVAKMGGAA